MHHWLCVIYTKGISEDEYVANLCAEIGDFQHTGGLCIVANVQDASAMAILSDTLGVARARNAPNFSISVGEIVFPDEVVLSNGHIHRRSTEVASSDQYSFVTMVLRAILTILRARRVGR